MYDNILDYNIIPIKRIINKRTKKYQYTLIIV